MLYFNEKLYMNIKNHITLFLFEKSKLKQNVFFFFYIKLILPSVIAFKLIKILKF